MSGDSQEVPEKKPEDQRFDQIDKSDGRMERTITGRTMADVIEEILSRPKRCFALLALLGSTLAIAIVVALLFTHLFHLETSEVQFGSQGSHVVFEHDEELTGEREYLVVVSPQGWESTDVPVRAGEKVTLWAGGKICIDMNEIWNKVQLRLKYEDEIARAKNIRRKDSTENRVPEDYFTDEQKQSLILDRPWVGPEGFSLDTFLPSFRSRRSRYLLPDKPAGGLIAAVKPGADEPSKTDAFFVGQQWTFSSPKDGSLWFTVNDVQYKLPGDQDLFYNDNLGAFWVDIRVSRH